MPSTSISVVPGQLYYIHTLAFGGGAYSAGAYALQVNFGSSSQPLASPPNTTVLDQASTGAGSGFAQRTGSRPTGLDTFGLIAPSTIDDAKGAIRLGGVVGAGDALIIAPTPSSRHRQVHLRPTRIGA